MQNPSKPCVVLSDSIVAAGVVRSMCVCVEVCYHVTCIQGRRRFVVTDRSPDRSGGVRVTRFAIYDYGALGVEKNEEIIKQTTKPDQRQDLHH